MALFKWNDDLSVKVASFDTHHKRLIDLINELHDSMLVGKHQTVIGKNLKELLDYTRYHFENEERLMLAHKYADYGQHKLQHDNFVAKVRECISKYESESGHAVSYCRSYEFSEGLAEDPHNGNGHGVFPFFLWQEYRVSLTWR